MSEEVLTDLPRVATTSEIRANFPALERTHRGFPVAFFDGPGGTQVPRQVVDAMADYLFHHNANTHWCYPTSQETDVALAAARKSVGAFVNSSPEEIVFGPNMTSLTYHLSRTLGRQMREGDEIVVTELDHHANIDSWKALEVERGVVVRSAKMDPSTGQLDWVDFQRQFGPRTRVLAVGAASNALGTVNDVNRAAETARSFGALVFVDAVHYAAHALCDVTSFDCDFLACSSYKFYGPHLGILYGRKHLLQGLDFPKLRPSPDYAPDRAETGTQNHEGIVGAAAAVEFLADLAAASEDTVLRRRLEITFGALHERSLDLTARLWDGLSGIDDVTLFGPSPEERRTPTVSFVLRGYSSEEVSRLLAERGIFVSHGDFYALTVVERLGIEGLIRVGCGCYTTKEEVERLVDAVRQIANRT